jgi:hypothetical protein
MRRVDRPQQRLDGHEGHHDDDLGHALARAHPRARLLDRLREQRLLLKIGLEHHLSVIGRGEATLDRVGPRAPLRPVICPGALDRRPGFPVADR